MIHRRTRLPSLLALLALLPFLSSCESGDSGDLNDLPPQNDVAIVLKAWDAGPNAFAPSNLVVSAGGSVKWYNADLGDGYGGESGTPHYLVSDDGTTFDSGVIEPDGVFKATFTTPGTYAYHCEFHEEMVGTITVKP